MGFRSEYAEWRDELEPPPKRTIAERLAAWIGPPAPTPEPTPTRDVYAMRSVAELMPIGDDHE